MEEEAGECAETQKDVDHEDVHGGAVSGSVNRRKYHLESEKGAGGEEVYEHGGFGDRFLHSLCHDGSFLAVG